MKIAKIKSAEHRAKLVSRLRKKFSSLFEPSTETRPIFIAGQQRSGTTMLMNVFHLHPDTAVFDESRESPVFLDFRIRSMEILERSVRDSKKPFACYKIISDSHILPSFIEAFPTARVIWSYRGAADNAASALKKFPHATRAIRLVCEGKPGGGWFAEGVSLPVAEQLRSLPLAELSEFDYACLVWWARNQLLFELEVDGHPAVRLLRYETLAPQPVPVLRALFEWLGVRWLDPVCRFVHSRSIRKANLPAMHPAVATLCNALERQLDELNAAQWPLLVAEDGTVSGEQPPAAANAGRG
jgi:hypothetical protein